MIHANKGGFAAGNRQQAPGIRNIASFAIWRHPASAGGNAAEHANVKKGNAGKDLSYRFGIVGIVTGMTEELTVRRGDCVLYEVNFSTGQPRHRNWNNGMME